MVGEGNAVMCGWVACSSGFSFAAALLAGVKIGTSYYAWMSQRQAVMAYENNSQGQSFSSGSWAHRPLLPARYLGLQFHINGETHFGWARLTVQFRATSPRSWVTHVTGYAYETIPGKPIIAGQTTDQDEDAASRLNETAPIERGWMARGLRNRQNPASPAPSATLVALALGAQGMSIWRREQHLKKD